MCSNVLRDIIHIVSQFSITTADLKANAANRCPHACHLPWFRQAVMAALQLVIDDCALVFGFRSNYIKLLCYTQGHR